jgi:tetratricopeptide (TPR) repeat protein
MVLNPVERRMVELCQYWEAFCTKKEKRLLVWQVPDSEARMLQCFFEAQKHESEYSTGDFFIVLDAPFINSIQYSKALKEAIAGHYEASRTELGDQKITADWKFDLQEYSDSASGFVQGLRSFGSKHHKHFEHLVAVLMPISVSDKDAWASWMSRALDNDIPKRLRLAAVDYIGSPRLTGLSAKAQELSYFDTPKIDTLTTAQETFAQEAVAGPAGVFRNYLIGLMTLVEKGSADQVKAKAVDSIAFARKQKWVDQEVVVSMLVAGAMLKEKRFPESIQMYQHARQSASQAVVANHPVGSQLVLQTWFGEAGVHLAAADVPQAIKCYEQAADVAIKIPNLILAIEALRMGAFCYARIQKSELSIERGYEALAAGERLKPDARAMTTLPLVAIEILRAIEPQRVVQMEGIRHRLDTAIAAIDETAENKAVELENSLEHEKFSAAEKKLVRDTNRAERDAGQELDAVALAGNLQFVKAFAYARELLGNSWPLASAIALPPAVQSATAEPQGVSAS